MKRGNKIWLGVGLLLVCGLMAGGLVACDDSDAVASYCAKVNYCFPGTAYVDCVEAERELEDVAITRGALCHEAFVTFHECIGGLSCADLDAYYADSSHCGTSYAAYQNRCGGL